jgi:hypothetical protein
VNEPEEVIILTAEVVPVSGRFFVAPDSDAPAVETVEAVHPDWMPHMVRHPSGAYFCAVQVPAAMPENSRELYWG